MSDEATGVPDDAATPTEILTPPAAQPPAPEKDRGPSKRLLVVLLVILGALVLALAGVLAAFLLRGDPAPAAQPVPLATQTVTLKWLKRNATVVALGVETSDAIDSPYQSGLAPSGSLTLNYSCGNERAHYTVTAAGADGKHISKTVTVTNPSFGK